MTDTPTGPRPIDTAEIVLGSTVVVLWAVSISGMVLAEAGAFGAVPLVVLAALASLAALGFAVRAYRASGVSRLPTSGRDWLGLVVVTVAAGWLFLPPADTVIEGSDASVYLAIGGMIASEGGVSYADPVVEALPIELRDGLFDTPRVPPLRHDFFPGGIQLTPEGLVEPNFFHLVPVWMAIGTVVFGAGAAAYLNPVFGVLAIAFVWALARRLSSSFGGLVAAALLAASFTQIWFARLPTAEVVTEAFVVAAVLGLAIAADRGPAVAAAVAGLAIGLVALTRVDGLLLVAGPLLAVGAYRWLEHRSDRRWLSVFLMAAGLGTLYAIAHAALFTGAYFQRVIRLAAIPRGTSTTDVVWVAGLGVIAVVALAMLIRFVSARHVRLVLVVGVAAVVIWVFATAGAAGRVPFLLAMSPIAAALLLAGLVVLPATRRLVAAWPAVLVFLVSALVYLQSPHEGSGMPMMLRRFVPVVLPLGMVFAGVAVAWLGGRRRWQTVMAVLAVLLVVRSLRPALPLVREPPNQGMRSAVADVAGLLPESSIAVVDSDAPSHLGLALRYQFDRLSLVLSSARQPESVERAVRAFGRLDRPVHAVVASTSVGATRLRRNEFGVFGLRPVRAVDLEFRAFAPSADRLPDAVEPVRRTVEVYEVIAPAAAGQELPLLIDIGELDFGWVEQGFHGPELIDGAGVRWTDGEARLIVPAMALPAGSTLAVTTRLSGSRPDAVSPTVDLDVADQAVGSFVAGPVMAEHRVELSRSAAERLSAGGVLTVRSESFVPAEFGSADGRRLGVLFDWIRVEVVEPPGGIR